MRAFTPFAAGCRPSRSATVSHRARRRAKRSLWGAVSAGLIALGTGVPIAGAFAAVTLVHPARADAPAVSASPFPGSATVGAIFEDGEPPSAHFCTGSVVDSPGGDLVLTAAHCTAGGTRLLFAPDYHDGRAPLGVWKVTAVFVDAPWKASSNPDDDFAFLKVVRTARSEKRHLQDATGAERVGPASRSDTKVRVEGYPDGASSPVRCTNRLRWYSSTQLQFDCGGYTDGTSGSPFVVTSAGSHTGRVVGVIGGYELGGDTPQVSYAARFGSRFMALYRLAEAASNSR